jgi:hypothetical protein
VGWLSYDPTLDLVYYGTGNPGPGIPSSGRATTSGRRACSRAPDTGEAVWFYQWSPHDLHDYDGVNENVLVDLAHGGGTRKVLLHPTATATCTCSTARPAQVLSRRSVRARHDVDRRRPEDRALVYDPRRSRARARRARHLPGVAGRQGLAALGLVAAHAAALHPAPEPVPGRETSQASYIAGTPYVGATCKMSAGPAAARRVTAWDPVARARRGRREERSRCGAARSRTAGDVVFYGTMDGWFKAVDARTGSCCGSSRPARESSASR